MKTYPRFLNWIATLLIPVITILGSIRILLTPIFIQVEYHLPGFPEDLYGFTTQERLYWADISRKYLLNKEGIEFLADRQLDPDTPLYNQRELRHMLDVKVVVGGAMIVLYSSLLFVIVLSFWAKRTPAWGAYRGAISHGGWLSVSLILIVLVYLGINFNSLFTNFHRIFFEGDSWLFKYSDTLIRLFPLQFWRDAFIWIGVFSLTTGTFLGYLFSRGSD